MTRGEFFRRLVGIPLVGAMAQVLGHEDEWDGVEPLTTPVEDGEWTWANSNGADSNVIWVNSGTLTVSGTWQVPPGVVIRGNTFG